MAPAYSGQVPICMRCQGRDIRQQSVGDGLWPAGGEGVAWVCDGCGHIGAPLLVDPLGDPRPDGKWDQEIARIAAEPETDSASAPTGGEARRPSAWGLLLVAIGVLFLVPGIAALQGALVHGTAWDWVRAIVGTGWLSAIGLVLLLLGVRRWRRPVSHAASPDPL